MRAILLFLVASVAFAEPPKIDIAQGNEITTNLCDYAEVTVKSDAEGVLWQVPDGVKRFDPKKLVDPNTAYFKFPKTGTYWLTVIAAKVVDKKVEFNEKRIKFLVVDAEKKDDKKDVIPVDPPVKPEPKPEPQPQPIATSKLVVIVIEETADAAETRGKFFGDKALAAKIEQRQHKVLAIDKDVKDKTGKTPATLIGYLNQARQLPWVVMVNDDTKKVVFSGPMPNDAKAALDLLVKYGG